MTGVYTMQLVVSDALISNPQVIPLAQIKIQLGESAAADSKATLYQARPEIKHVFRPADPRPSKLVSTIFSALCAAPLAILIVLVIFKNFIYINFISVSFFCVSVA